MDVKTIFAARLKELREEAGLSQVQFGEKIGISRGSISYYENCDRTPDIVFLKKVADFFNVSLDYLLGNCNTKNPENTNIGKELNLTDKAIEKIKQSNIIPYLPGIKLSILNSIVEHDLFLSFLANTRTAVCMQCFSTDNKTACTDQEVMLVLRDLAFENGMVAVPQEMAARIATISAANVIEGIIHDITKQVSEEYRRGEDGQHHQEDE